MANRRPLVTDGGRARELASGDGLVLGSSAAPGVLNALALTAPRTFELPDQSGVIVLRSDLAASLRSNPAYVFEEAHDLVTFSPSDFTSYVSVGGTVNFVAGSPGHPGVAEITTLATPATSNGFLRATNPAASYESITVGGGELIYEALFEIPALWPASNTGQLRLGFMDEISGAPTNGVHLQYDDASPNWRLAARAGGVLTSITSDAPVTVGWHHARIVISADGTAATLAIDNMIVATVSSGLPTAGFSYGAQVQKTAGTTPMVLRVDLLRIKQVFATPRYVPADISAFNVYQRGIEFKNSGSALIAAEADVTYVRVPVSGNITKAIAYGSAGGSCVFDVYLGARGSTTSITGASKPTLVADDYYEDATLAGWITSVTAGQWLGFKLESSSDQILAGCLLEIAPS